CHGLTQLGTLYEIRGLMMRSYISSYDVQKAIDNRVEALRVPLSGGGYRWVRWTRPNSDAPVDKQVHEVRAVKGSGADTFEGTADHPFNVKVVIPAKRSLFNKNGPVYVGTLHVTYTVNGRQTNRDLPINDWMNPDTSRVIEFDTIADHAEATVDVSVAANDAGKAVAEIHFRQAVAEDDPANPDYPTIQALMRVRSSPDAATVDGEIAALERGLFPASDPVPLLTIINDLRRADKWMQSSKTDEQEKGQKLLKETLKRLR
ncbi:MAG: hypothetical protein ACXVIJ_13915, partial [Thermoanaerobaculia bacterium]